MHNHVQSALASPPPPRRPSCLVLLRSPSAGGGAHPRRLDILMRAPTPCLSQDQHALCRPLRSQRLVCHRVPLARCSVQASALPDTTGRGCPAKLAGGPGRSRGVACARDAHRSTLSSRPACALHSVAASMRRHRHALPLPLSSARPAQRSAPCRARKRQPSQQARRRSAQQPLPRQGCRRRWQRGRRHGPTGAMVVVLLVVWSREGMWKPQPSSIKPLQRCSERRGGQATCVREAVHAAWKEIYCLECAMRCILDSGGRNRTCWTDAMPMRARFMRSM